MRVEKKSDKEEIKIKPKIEHYYLWKKTPMVRISGDFFGGGFNLSKNKAKAIIENIEAIRNFASGKLDEDIKKLKDEEVLIP